MIRYSLPEARRYREKLALAIAADVEAERSINMSRPQSAMESLNVDRIAARTPVIATRASSSKAALRLPMRSASAEPTTLRRSQLPSAGSSSSTAASLIPPRPLTSEIDEPSSSSDVSVTPADSRATSALALNPTQLTERATSATSTSSSRPVSVNDIIEKRRFWTSYASASPPAPPPVSYDVLQGDYESVEVAVDESIFGKNPPKEVVRAKRAARLNVKTMQMELQKYELEDKLRAMTAERKSREAASEAAKEREVLRLLREEEHVVELDEAQSIVDADIRADLERDRAERQARKAADAAEAERKRREFKPKFASPWTLYSEEFKPILSRPQTAPDALLLKQDGASPSGPTAAGSASPGKRPCNLVNLRPLSEVCQEQDVDVQQPPPRDVIKHGIDDEKQRTIDEHVRLIGVEMLRQSEQLEPSGRSDIENCESAVRVLLAGQLVLEVEDEPLARRRVMDWWWRELKTLKARCENGTSKLQITMWHPEMTRDREHLLMKEQQRLADFEESRKLLREEAARQKEAERQKWRDKWSAQRSARDELLALQRTRLQLREDIREARGRLSQHDVPSDDDPLDVIAPDGSLIKESPVKNQLRSPDRARDHSLQSPIRLKDGSSPSKQRVYGDIGPAPQIDVAPLPLQNSNRDGALVSFATLTDEPSTTSDVPAFSVIRDRWLSGKVHQRKNSVYSVDLGGRLNTRGKSKSVLGSSMITLEAQNPDGTTTQHKSISSKKQQGQRLEMMEWRLEQLDKRREALRATLEE